MPNTGLGDARVTLDDLNARGKDDFVSGLADIYEHSSWVADKVYELAPFASLTRLHVCMQEAVANASETIRLELLQAHPDLAGKAALAGNLTESSSAEQEKTPIT